MPYRPERDLVVVRKATLMLLEALFDRLEPARHIEHRCVSKVRRYVGEPVYQPTGPARPISALGLTTVGLLELVAVGEDIGAADAPMRAAPLERDVAGFEPADKGRTGHAEQHGCLSGRQHLVGCRGRAHVIVHDASEDRVHQLGCCSR